MLAQNKSSLLSQEQELGKFAKNAQVIWSVMLRWALYCLSLWDPGLQYGQHSLACLFPHTGFTKYFPHNPTAAPSSTCQATPRPLQRSVTPSSVPVSVELEKHNIRSFFIFLSPSICSFGNLVQEGSTGGLLTVLQWTRSDPGFRS